MAKRKRLSPAALLEQAEVGFGTQAANGASNKGTNPPIADVTRDSATRAALDEVTDELRNAREGGRMVVDVPLQEVNAHHLVRDRIAFDDDAMVELKSSLRARGQQTPIEVVRLSSNEYGLISGWRRLCALRDLLEETDDKSFATVKALVRLPESASDAYLAMVEENEVRSDLSFYERARIAVKAAEEGVFATPLDAVQVLYASALKGKRSKVHSFTYLVSRLDDALRFPEAIPEKLGLPMVKLLQNDPYFEQLLRQALRETTPKTPKMERDIIEQVLADMKPSASSGPNKVTKGVQLKVSKGRVTLSGAGVTETFLSDLRHWLSERGLNQEF